jgi:hypothetical protein
MKPLGPKDYLKPGDWNAFCDECGFKFKASELRLRWDGCMCCKDDWELRNEQDFLRSMPEKPTTPFSRPRNDTEPAGPTDYVQYGPADWNSL